MSKNQLINTSKFIGSTSIVTSLLLASFAFGLFTINSACWVFIGIFTSVALLINAIHALKPNFSLEASHLINLAHKINIFSIIVLCLTGPTFALGASIITAGIGIGSLTALVGSLIFKIKERASLGGASNGVATAPLSAMDSWPQAQTSRPQNSSGHQCSAPTLPVQWGMPLNPESVHQGESGSSLTPS